MEIRDTEELGDDLVGIAIGLRPEDGQRQWSGPLPPRRTKPRGVWRVPSGEVRGPDRFLRAGRSDIINIAHLPSFGCGTDVPGEIMVISDIFRLRDDIQARDFQAAVKSSGPEATAKKVPAGLERPLHGPRRPDVDAVRHGLEQRRGWL